MPRRKVQRLFGVIDPTWHDPRVHAEEQKSQEEVRIALGGPKIVVPIETKIDHTPG